MKYLLTWAGSFPGHRMFNSLSELREWGKEWIKQNMAQIFKADDEGNIVEINSNGKIKK